MKEKYFKIKESCNDVITSMSDRQAGQFIKALCDYSFNGQVYTGKDVAIKSAFYLVKVDMDEQKFFREKGRIGYEKKLENQKKKEYVTPVLTRVVAQGEKVSDLVKTIIGMREMANKEDNNATAESVAK